MGLKQGIVIVNEFTVKNGSGKGSRGATPGDYITRYMSRDKASETLTPVKLKSEDDYILRYMSRESAVEKLDSRDEVKPTMKSMQRYGGVAFGYGKISLADDELIAASQDIQANFDKGKTVMKTVLSFDEEYLREMGIIPEHFVCQSRGDFRGNVDQMKLRLAIMHGLDKLSQDYSDLQYVGTIQVDTKHVHCHLAMVDRGEGNLTKNGTQRGKISSAQKDKIRRGIDLFLDENKTIQHMASNIDMDKRNTAMFIKQVSHKTMEQNGISQLLIACLPPDKRLWRASSNDKRMLKANSLTREYVRELFAQPESGYDKIRRSIYEYANARRSREDLTGREYRRLIVQGEKNVEDACINSVYGLLSSMQKRDRTVQTPMIDLMAMPAHDIGKDADEFGEFTYKLRTYSTRLDYHKHEREKAHQIVEDYETAEAAGQVSESSRAVYDFFKFEEDYNERLMCKYQSFLHFLPPGKKYQSELREILDYRARLGDLESMYLDKNIKRMKPDNAEDYGERVYNQRGGRYMTFNPDIIAHRLDTMRERLAKKDKDFAYRIATDSLMMDENDDGTITLTRRTKHKFDDVKALDIHHLEYDSATDMLVSQSNIDIFVETARRRAALAQAAMAYLEASGQEEELHNIPIRDIRLMSSVADEITITPYVKSLRKDISENSPSPTINLAKKFDISLAVQQSLNNIAIEREARLQREAIEEQQNGDDGKKI